MPDRGYNTGTVFSDYAARLQFLDFTFTPYTSTAPVPGANGTEAQRLAAQSQIQATYRTGVAFNYLNGTTPTVTTGLDPGANTSSAYLGKTLPFVPTAAVGGNTFSVNKITFDSEALVLRADGSGFIGDEYGANIYHFNAAKQIDGVITPPAAVQPHAPAGTLNFNSGSAPVNGRRNNQGMEGVSLSPDGTRLFALLQSATVQDTVPGATGNSGRLNTRLLIYDVSGGNNTPSTPVGEYVLRLPTYTQNGGGGAVNATAAQSEIVVLNDHQFLVLSRDGNGLGTGSANPAVFKSVLLVDLNGATNIAGQFDTEAASILSAGALNPSITPLSSAEALNLLNTAELSRFGFNLNNAAPDRLTLSEKIEGMSLVSALDPNAPNDYFLFVANDNDFITANGQMPQADGGKFTYDAVTGQARLAENDTVFLAYRVTVVPEPGIGALLLAAGVALVVRRRRQEGAATTVR